MRCISYDQWEKECAVTKNQGKGSLDNENSQLYSGGEAVGGLR